MNYKGHIMLGVGCWAGYVGLTNTLAPETPISLLSAALVLPVVGFASLLPDVDHPESTLGRRISPFSDVLALFSHRGITHSLWAVLLIFWLLNRYESESVILQSVLIGYLSHLLGDAITPAGVRLWWPFGRNQRINIQQSVMVVALGIFVCLGVRTW